EIEASGLSEQTTAIAMDPNELPTADLEIPEDLQFTEFEGIECNELFNKLEDFIRQESNVKYNASCLQMTPEPNEVPSPSFESVSSASEDEEDKMLRLEFVWKILDTDTKSKPSH
ncbi:unnamed protein product, partial [Allacma fusca]